MAKVSLFGTGAHVDPDSRKFFETFDASATITRGYQAGTLQEASLCWAQVQDYRDAGFVLSSSEMARFVRLTAAIASELENGEGPVR